MDVSDGLAGDLAKLCRASGVGAMVDGTRVPLSPAAQAAVRAEPGLLEAALSGGDDYEIVCTVPPARLTAFQKAAKAAGVPVADIGRIVRGQGAVFHDRDGKPLRFKRSSFSHF
jgi:thiamine-monophosphate kinase